MRYNPIGIEKVIQDAQKEGKFDDLEHKGQPLQVAFGDLASVANDVMRDNGIVPEWIELSRQIETLQERQEALVESLARRREADRGELDRALEVWAPRERGRRGWNETLRDWWLGDREAEARRRAEPPAIVERMEKDRRRTLVQLAELVRAERKKVDRFNLVLPIGGRQMRRVRPEERLQQYQERFPSLTLAQSSGAWQVHERVEAVDPALLTTPEEEAAARTHRGTPQVEALDALRASRRRPRGM